jgi:putative glycosyltransferase (TIGR04372 family)
MWKRKLSIYSFVYVLSRVNKWLPGYEAHEIKRHYILNIHGILAKTSTHLSFTPQEDSLGREAITKLGVPEDADFVCFLARDQVYLNTWLSKDLSNPGDCEYLYRNSSIHNYLLAMEELTKLGYYVFRMGAIVEEPLKTNNQMIIDYAIKYRSEFLDIYLSAKCSFFVIDTAGLGFVPVIFRRPIAFTNIIPLEHGSTWHKDSLWLPKKLWHKNERRFLSFYEILELGAAKMNKTSEYQKAGLEIVENTSDEIADLVMEMDMRLKGTWYPSEEDEDLQQRFNTLIKQSPLHGEILARIGAKFLHQNRDLL